MNKADTVSAITAPASNASYSSRVNPQWVQLIAILEMNAPRRHRLGTKLSTGLARALRPDWLQNFTGVAPDMFALEES